jgi:hypothetical protein
LSFIEESEPGDLAFDNEEGRITHGHHYGKQLYYPCQWKVQIDRLDHLGIYNAEVNKYP